jgi:small subunit ribosomal protein S19
MAAETAKKHFTFRGKTLDELQKMDVREFAKLLKSRGRRFAMRHFQEIEKFLDRANSKIGKNKQIKTHLRDMMVVPRMVGMKIGVHDGRKFAPVDIVEEMLGHRLGEFAVTRQKIKHGKAGIGATKGTKAKAK